MISFPLSVISRILYSSLESSVGVGFSFLFIS